MYKAILRDPALTGEEETIVAIKEMHKNEKQDKEESEQEDDEVKKIYEFQHEMLIMRFVLLLIINLY